MKNLKNIFTNDDGSIKFSVYGIGIALITIFGLLYFTQSIGLAFHRFFRVGIFMILGPIIAYLWVRHSIKQYNKSQTVSKYAAEFIVPVLLWLASIFGPLVAIKADKSSGIPDSALYYNNGTIKDLNLYFKNVKLSQQDSLYVVQYGEEPGININNAYRKIAPDSLKSHNPRSSEYWTRPDLNDKIKLKGKY